jgi:hypothetical protein
MFVFQQLAERQLQRAFSDSQILNLQTRVRFPVALPDKGQGTALFFSATASNSSAPKALPFQLQRHLTKLNPQLANSLNGQP